MSEQLKRATPETPKTKWAKWRAGRRTVSTYLAPEIHAEFHAKSRAQKRTMTSQLEYLVCEFAGINQNNA